MRQRLSLLRDPIVGVQVNIDKQPMICVSLLGFGRDEYVQGSKQQCPNADHEDVERGQASIISAVVKPLLAAVASVDSLDQ